MLQSRKGLGVPRSREGGARSPPPRFTTRAALHCAARVNAYGGHAALLSRAHPRPPPAQVPRAFGEYVQLRDPYPFPYPRGRALYVKRHQTEPRGGKRVHKRGPWMFFWSQFGCARARTMMDSFTCECTGVHSGGHKLID